MGLLHAVASLLGYCLFCAARLDCTCCAFSVPAFAAMFSSLYQNLPTAAAMLPSAGRKADGETTALTAARKTATAYSSEVHDTYVFGFAQLDSPRFPPQS